MVRVEILAETRRAWTYFFEYPQLIFALFFLFFFDFQIHFLLSDLISNGEGTCGKGYKIPVRILYSFMDLFFEDAWS